MTAAWSRGALHKIDDGATYGTPTWIWSVVVEGALYVHAYHGQDSRWYHSALPGEVRRQFVSRRDARHSRPLRDNQGPTARAQ